ncbi:hypothetical protein SmJEL517_g00393 [Synchytrium microbalum]|uniref:Ran guanine nucleotide release factor n=1 Tax=Synchytrium microbalum TaxID=1806994 RepID=A0A507C8V5_9FUNG|nr:uncharacterized protein SmJEL517_g00393 [Synchytrium microbalum]TPX38020.1 hypothetical protein SmJEL517_g00393 [Synchytrium microbalum]
MVVANEAHQELFGGAIRVWIPQGFDDVSEIRQVPDNQTVYASPATDESISIEILESPADHISEIPAQFHFQQLADDNDAIESALGSIENLRAGIDLPNLRTGESVSIAIGTQKIAKFNETVPNTVNIYVAVIRLARENTDILISYNHPIEIDARSSSTTIERATTVPAQVALTNFQAVVKSFTIVDYGLFA